MLSRAFLKGSRLRNATPYYKFWKRSLTSGNPISASVKFSEVINPKKVYFRKASFTAGATFAALLSYFFLDPSEGDITVSELRKHNSINDCWIALNGQVYDITSFLQKHPGGVARLLEVAGSDATDKFYQIHSDAVFDKMKDNFIFVGNLSENAVNELTEEEMKIMEMKKRLPPLSAIFSVSDFENIAKHVLPKSTFMYYATGASDEFTIRENHYAYCRVFFRPRVLHESVREVDTSTTFLGTKVSLPFYITAFAGSKLAHPLGELNLQSASYDANVMQMVPKMMSYGIDKFFEHVPADQNQWMQYHFDDQQEVEDVVEFVRKMEKQPSVKGFFFNVDLADIGNREKDSRQRSAEADTEELDMLVSNTYNHYPLLTWSTIDKILEATDLPVGLKGIQRGEDVVIAAEKGVKAVVLSNHGGRQLDFSRPPLEVLAEAKAMLKEKNLDDKIELYIDGGIRRGSDIIKALCLGAKGVGLGRPFLYAMAGYGEDGVSKIISLLEGEIQNNMRLLGVGRIEDLNESFIDAKNLALRNPRTNDALYDEAYEQLFFPQFKRSV
ncbi:hypothetical protein HG537_0E05920 [Torulaspora globosa]|uniref:Cytochrome b2, mitochondrial n=1 Tax=Torulaspora globosa TaxID=48254 RepID=A0A7H9HWD8_9SACH|nr:hypothetical protein HG537_0E05920 [Torulaspora sp. CBS 2947]